MNKLMRQRLEEASKERLISIIDSKLIEIDMLRNEKWILEEKIEKIKEFLRSIHMLNDEKP